MQKIIIIGATSGIGRELAKLYTQHGDIVGITGRRENKLIEFQQQFPDQVHIECFDVTGTGNLSHLDSLINKLGGLDILIYSAGYGEVSKELSWEIDKQTTLTNVNGFVEIINYTFNYFLRKGRRGQIAAISSIASKRGNSAAPAYSASKAYMSTYMEGLAVKARKMKTNIAITDIQPGFVNTKMAKGDTFFWVAKVEKAAKQIYSAIARKKRRVYVSRRWIIIAWVLKWLPYPVFRKIA